MSREPQVVIVDGTPHQKPSDFAMAVARVRARQYCWNEDRVLREAVEIDALNSDYRVQIERIVDGFLNRSGVSRDFEAGMTFCAKEILERIKSIK